MIEAAIDLAMVEPPENAGVLGSSTKKPAPKARSEERRCLVTRSVADRALLLRFVVDPTGQILPDVDERLPGRGIWLSAGRDVVDKAVEKRLFGKAAKQSVTVLDGLVDRIEALLSRRFYDGLGLARRAGLIVMGFDQVQASLAGSGAAVLLAAADGAEDGRREASASGARSAFDHGGFGSRFSEPLWDVSTWCMRPCRRGN